MKLLVFLAAFQVCSHILYAADDVFEVKATSINSVFYREGKIERSEGGDQVVYEVNIPQGIVKRTAVYNAGIKDGLFAGLQSDNTVYKIVHDESNIGKRLIKAIGQAGFIDGYETIVIGDTFVTTSKSTDDYFTLYYYKRAQ